MLEPILLLPLLPGVQCNGTAAQDSVLYQQFLSGEHGMVEGIPNLALAAMIFAPLGLVLIIACLVKKYKEKRQNEVKEVDNLPSPRAEEEPKPKKKGDIFEEIESEIERHEEHKKKLGAYLKFLSTRDGGNIARTNRKRVKRGSDEEEEEEEDEDERIERIELQRQQLSQQLKTMLQANNSNNNNPTARAAMQQRQMPPVILD